MKIQYYGQDPSYFSRLKKIIDILKAFDFPVQNITCVFDDMYVLGTEQYIIEGDDNTFTITVDPEGQYYLEYNNKTDLVGDPDDEIEQIAHYIDVIINGPDEDLRDLFESLIREDKRTDFFEKYKQLPLDWKPNDSDDVKRAFFEALWGADTSSNKKYIPWFFNVIENEGRPLSPIGLDTSLRRVSDFMSYIETNITDYVINEFKRRISDGDLRLYSSEFEKITKSPKDINSYPTINSIREFYSHIKELKFNKEQIKKAKKESEKIFEDSNFLIVEPLTHDASCVYGRETKWCVASKDSSRYFDDYTRNSKFYYVINKKSRDSRYSKFALRIPTDGGEIEVWDQQDNRSSFDVMFEKIPEIQPILRKLLRMGETEYETLMGVKNGEIQPAMAFRNTSDYQITKDSNGNLILNIMFESYGKYFKQIFKNVLYEETIQQILSLLNPYYSPYEYFDEYTGEQDVKEGYAFYSLEKNAMEYLDDIIKLLNPELYSKKESMDNSEYFESVGKFIQNYSDLFDYLAYEYTSAKNSAINDGLQQAITDEYCDILSVLNIETEKCFYHYKTSVDNALELYSELGKTTPSIKAMLAQMLDSKTSVDDIFENYYEYSDNETFDSNWQPAALSILEKFYDKITDEDDGFFDDLDEHRELIDYVINGFGFNINREIKTQPGSYFKILEVSLDNKIKIEINKGYERRHYLLSPEQLETLVRNYKLF